MFVPVFHACWARLWHPRCDFILIIIVNYQASQIIHSTSKMLLGGFDFLLIVIDYLSYFFEPFLAVIQTRLPFLFNGSLFKLRGAPRRTIRTTLADLSFEVENFHSQHLNRLTDTEGTFKSVQNLLKQLQRSLKSRWPKSSIHTVGSDLLGRRLNWPSCDVRVASDDPKVSVCALQQMADQNGTSIEQQTNPDMKQTSLAASVDLNVIHSCPDNKTILLHVADLDVASHRTPNLLCLVKLYTPEESHLIELRSSLVFRYTQLYPELGPLFLIVSTLLERAKLIEAGGRILSTDLSSYDGPSATCSFGQHNQSWLKLLHRSMVKETPNTEMLSRYDLVLMLVAYLNSEKARQLTANSKSNQHLLGSLLLGFLAAYSVHHENKQQLVYCVRKVEGNQSDKLELVYPKTDGEENTKIVLSDPVDDNETSYVSCWPQISDLFAKMTSKLNKELASPPVDSSLLSALLEMSQPEAKDESAGIVSEWLQSAKQYEENNSKRRSTSTRADSGRWFERFSKRKIMNSFFYLILFLVARNFILNYLQRWQRDLKHQARDDFIELKRQLFPESLDHETLDLGKYLAEGDDEEDHRGRVDSPGVESGAREDPIWTKEVAEAQTGEANEKDELDKDQQAQLMEALMSAMMSRMFSSGNLKPEDLMGELLGGGGGGGDGDQDGGDAAEKLRRISEMFSGAAGGDGDVDSAAMMAELFSQMGGQDDEDYEDDDRDDDDTDSDMKDYDFDLGQVKRPAEGMGGAGNKADGGPKDEL